MYSIDTRLCCAFMKTASWWLSLVASGMWPFSFLFAEPLGAQHYSHWGILALMELPRWLNICVDMGIPSFACAFASTLGITTLSQAYALVRINLPAVGWLLSFFYSFGWRIVSDLIEHLFCGLYTILLGCYVLFHGQAFSFGNTMWVLFLEKYPWRTQVASIPK